MAAAARDEGTSTVVQPEEPKQETANGSAGVEKAGSPAPEEPVKEGSGAEDSDATVRSTSEDTSPPSPRYSFLQDCEYPRPWVVIKTFAHTLVGILLHFNC